MISLSPAKAKPSTALLLLRRGGLLLRDMRVVDVVPRHVQEERFHGDGLHLWRVWNQLAEVGVLAELMQTLHERALGRRARLGAASFQRHESTILSDHPPQSRSKSVDLCTGDVKSRWSLGASGGLRNRGAREIECLREESKCLCWLAKKTVGSSQGQASAT